MCTEPNISYLKKKTQFYLLKVTAPTLNVTLQVILIILGKEKMEIRNNKNFFPKMSFTIAENIIIKVFHQKS